MGRLEQKSVLIIDLVKKEKFLPSQPEARDNYTTRFRQLIYYISNEKSVYTDFYTMEEIEEELDEMEPAQNAEVEKTVDVEKEQKEHLLRTHPEPALRQPRL